MSAAAVTSFRTHARRLGVIRHVTILSLLLLLATAPASAIDIIFNNILTISDNGAGDLNAAANILQFNTFMAGYQMAGTIDLLTGSGQSALIGSPTANVRMTNFTATAVGTPPNPMFLKFQHQFTGSFPTIVAGDSLDARASHATGAPVPAGVDNILDWQGFVDADSIFPLAPGVPPFPNPALPPSSPPLPYTVVTHGASTMPNSYNNPTIGAYLTFQLGANGNQIELPSSAEVGFVAVPEPSTFALAGLGAVGVFAMYRRIRKQAAKCSAGEARE